MRPLALATAEPDETWAAIRQFVRFHNPRASEVVRITRLPVAELQQNGQERRIAAPFRLHRIRLRR
jgi:hypothetical protein